MTFDNNSRKLALLSCMTALVLAGCGGGGGASAPAPAPAPEVQTPMWVVTGVDAVTASVKVTNASGADLAGVQVLVSSVSTVDTSSDGSGSGTTKDVTLYNSSEDLGSSQAIANNGNFTFALKNVNFSAAGNDSGKECTADVTALGQVFLEVLDQGNELSRQTVQVCDLQGKTYSVSVK